MASSMSSWSALRPLRPVLIAGAAAIAWLSFSAPSADASTQPAGDSLVGGITAPATSASSSGTDRSGLAARALKAVDGAARAEQPDVSIVPVLAASPEAVPAGAAPAPETAEYVPALAAEIVAPVEAAVDAVRSSEALPAQVGAPVASLAEIAVDRVAESISQTVVAPAAEAAADVAEAPVAASNSGSSDHAESETQSTAPTADAALETTGITVEASSIDSILLSVSVPSATAAHSFLAPSGNGPVPAGDDSRLDPVLPAPPPGSGSGNGQSSGGPFASAAWLTRPFEHFTAVGLFPARGPLQHVPSPIALEPGSSPD